MPPGAGKTISIGKHMEREKILSKETQLQLNTLTLHGLIGGSTGTGKSKAIQVIAERLNQEGIPVLLADLKGDMGGFIKPGISEIAKKRAKMLGENYSPAPFPTNFFSVSGKFIPFRIRLDEIDPILVGRVLRLNTTQESNLRLVFIYAREKGLPLRDLVDLKGILSNLSKGKHAPPGTSKTSINVILRQLSIAIGEGMNELFGEPSLELPDLLTPKINILNLGNWRKRSDFPAILMSFMLYRLFHELEDVGSVEKPKIVLFIDEAHYLFQKSSSNLQELFVTVLKQIRSKGVSVFLSSQNPEDIPEKVLEQLGCKIQFALRAFTEEELRDIRGIAKTFPPTKKYNLAQEIMGLKIAEAIVSPLGAKGRPIAPAKTAIYAPMSSMDVIPVSEISKSLDKDLLEKYSQVGELERYDFTEPLENIRLGSRSSSYKEKAEAIRLSRKERRDAKKHWNRMKMIGAFVLAFLVLVIMALLVIFAITN
jgi:DNA helicase HerA-like ATPase